MIIGWEYRVILMKDSVAIPTGEAHETIAVRGYEKRLDKLGREGWELMSVDHGIAYFKRPLDTEKIWREKEAI